MEADEADMIFLILFLTAASRRLTVPVAKTSWASRGSSAHRVILIAAKWNKKSIFFVTLKINSLSVMSPSIISNLLLFKALSRFLNLPLLKSSITMIRFGEWTNSWSIVCEPIRPAPPVTRIDELDNLDLMV